MNSCSKRASQQAGVKPRAQLELRIDSGIERRLATGPAEAGRCSHTRRRLPASVKIINKAIVRPCLHRNTLLEFILLSCVQAFRVLLLTFRQVQLIFRNFYYIIFVLRDCLSFNDTKLYRQPRRYSQSLWFEPALSLMYATCLRSRRWRLELS
jgi:hypothetical protein